MRNCHRPVILWTDLGGKPKWLPLNFGYHDIMRRQAPLCNNHSGMLSQEKTNGPSRYTYLLLLITFCRFLTITLRVAHTFWPVPAGSLILSGLMSRMTQTADMTSLTPAGGCCMDLTMVMSEGCERATRNRCYWKIGQKVGKWRKRVSKTDRVGSKRLQIPCFHSYLEGVESLQSRLQCRDSFCQVAFTLCWNRHRQLVWNYVPCEE